MAYRRKEFALYKGDKFIMIGTAREIAEERGVKPETVRFWSTPAHHKRASKGKNMLIAIKLDDDDNEEI